MDAGTIQAFLTLDTSKFSQGLSQAQTAAQQFGTTLNSADSISAKFSNLGKGLQNIGKGLTIGVTAPLTGVFAKASSQAINFESAMTGVAKTTDMTGAELSEMSQAIRGMSKEIPATTTEIAGVAEAAGQLGISKENILDFSRTMIDMGQSTNLTSDIAATSFARFANITQMPEENMSRLGSTVVDLGNNMATTEAEIVEMGMRLAGTGTQVGLSQDQIMALAASMSSVGIQAEAGGTAMSTVMNKINNSVASGSDSLQGFAQVAGMSAKDFAQEWNTNPQAAMQAFVTGLGNVQASGGNVNLTLKELGITGIRETDTLNRLAGAGGLLGDAFNLANQAWKENSALSEEASKRYDTMESKFQIMKNNLSDAALVIGQSVVPILMELSEKVKSACEWFTNLNPSTQEFIVKAGLIAGAVGPVLMIFGKVASSVISIIPLVTSLGGVIGKAPAIIGAAGGALTKIPTLLAPIGGALTKAPALIAALSNPVTLAVAAIGAAVLLLVTHWDEVKAGFQAFAEAFSEGWENLKTNVSEKLANLGQAISEKWENIKQTCSQTLDNIKSNISSKWEAIKSSVSTAVENIRSTVSEKWESIKSSVTEKVESIKSSVKEKWEAIKSSVQSKMEEISSNLKSKWESIKTDIKSKMENIKSDLDSKWQSIKQKAQETWSNIKQEVSSKIGEMKQDISQRTSEMKSDMQNAWNNIKETVSTSWSNIKEKVKEGASTVLDNIKSMGANMVNALKDLPGKFLEIGGNILNGLVEGIKGGIANAVEGVKNAGKQIASSFKGVLGIHSPSTVFKGFGLNIIKGLEIGIAENSKNSVKEIKDLSKRISGAFNPDLQFGMDSGSFLVNHNQGNRTVSPSNVSFSIVINSPEPISHAEAFREARIAGLKFAEEVGL